MSSFEVPRLCRNRCGVCCLRPSAGTRDALHAPEVECIGKGKARKPYEFGVKVSLAIKHKQGLMVGARAFPGNPFDGHTLAQQLEQTTHLLQDLGRRPKQAIVDLGYRGADADNPGVEIIHRGKYKTLTALQRRWLKRRQAIVSKPALYGLNSVMDALSDLRDVLGLIRTAIRTSLGPPLPVGVSLGWR